MENVNAPVLAFEQNLMFCPTFGIELICNTVLPPTHVHLSEQLCIKDTFIQTKPDPDTFQFSSLNLLCSEGGYVKILCRSPVMKTSWSLEPPHPSPPSFHRFICKVVNNRIQLYLQKTFTHKSMYHLTRKG